MRLSKHITLGAKLCMFEMNYAIIMHTTSFGGVRRPSSKRPTTIGWPDGEIREINTPHMFSVVCDTIKCVFS